MKSNLYWGQFGAVISQEIHSFKSLVQSKLWTIAFESLKPANTKTAVRLVKGLISENISIIQTC